MEAILIIIMIGILWWSFSLAPQPPEPPTTEKEEMIEIPKDILEFERRLEGAYFHTHKQAGEPFRAFRRMARDIYIECSREKKAERKKGNGRDMDYIAYWKRKNVDLSG